MILFRPFRFLSFLLTIGTIYLSLVIASNSTIYMRDGDVALFLLEKGELRHNPIWLTSFYFHVVSACACLLVGAPLMIPALLKFKRTHKFLGYFYLNAVLWVAAPTGFIMGFVAKGGFWGATGFLLIGVAWWITTWNGYRAIAPNNEKRNVARHVRWMIRSYSIALSAVTFRLFQILLSYFLDDNMTIYIASIWLSMATSFLLSETCIYGNSFKKALQQHLSSHFVAERT